MKHIIRYKEGSSLYEYPADTLVTNVSLDEQAVDASFRTKDVQNKRWTKKVNSIVDNFDEKKFEPLYYCKKCRWIENGGHRIAVAHKLKRTVDVMVYADCASPTTKFSSRADWVPQWDCKPEKKVWGTTVEIFRNSTSTVHYLDIKKGGYCSEHKHNQKTNIFHVIKGTLKIDFWWKDDTKRTITIKAGQPPREIPVGFFHKFTAITDVSCIEIYNYKYDGIDIERRTVGGLSD